MSENTKSLLNENTIRRMMKMAQIDSLSDNFVGALTEKYTEKETDITEETEEKAEEMVAESKEKAAEMVEEAKEEATDDDGDNE